MKNDNHMARSCSWPAAIAALSLGAGELAAQPTAGSAPPLEWTTAQDHGDML